MDKTKLLKIKDVAKRLEVSERTIFRYIHSKRLKAYKLGHWKIKQSDVEKFILKYTNFK